MQVYTNLSQGFEPVAAPDARKLILGSMPGTASLDATQYYAFPHNVFWKIMGELFGAGPERDYRSRLQTLTTSKIALWDVVEACRRPGSLDSAIVAEGLRINDFAGFFDQHRHIKQVYFNGQKAAQLYKKYVLPSLKKHLKEHHEYLTLPSTSPAHASRSYTDKLKAWSVLKTA